MEERPRSPVRLLAPIALLAFVFALFVVLTGSDVEETTQPSGSREAEEADLGETTSPTETATQPDEESEGGLPDEFYVVKAGDTLAAIAQSVGVPVETLQELNPDLDPQALVSGQRIRLRE